MAETTSQDRANNAKAWLPVVATVAAGVGIVKFVVFPLLEGLNLKKTEEEEKKTEDKEVQNKEGIWTPNYYKAVIPGYDRQLYTYSASMNIAKKIYNAWGGVLNDKEEQVYAAFRSIPNKIVLSQVVERYAELTGEDLLEDLEARMSDTEVGNVLDIVSRYPSGYQKI